MVANVAHRGASGNYPENTLRAFQMALEMGVDEIELDLRMTLDGHLVVMHDATVDRTTDGTGAIGELTLGEIRALRAFRMVGDSTLACNDESVEIFAEIDPRIACRIFPNHRSPEDYIRSSEDMGLLTTQPGRDMTTPEFVQKAHESGLGVHVFYADALKDMRAYIEMGVDGILTNYPERLNEVKAETA